MDSDSIVILLMMAIVLFGAIVVVCLVVFLIVPVTKRRIAVINEFYKYGELHEQEFLAIAQKLGWTYSREVPESLRAEFQAFQNQYPGGKKDCFLTGRANGQPFLWFEVFVSERSSSGWTYRSRRTSYYHWNAIMLFGLDLDLPDFSLSRNAGRKHNVMQKYELTSQSPQAAAVLNPTALAKLDAGNALLGWGNGSTICVFREFRPFEPPSEEGIVDLLKDAWEFSETVRLTTPFARPLTHS